MITHAHTSMPTFAPAMHSVAMPATALISTYSTRNLGDAAIMRAIAGLVPGGIAHVSLQEDHRLSVPNLRFAGHDRVAADVRISVGGDIFNNSRPSFITRNFLAKVAELGRAPRSTIAFGQTIPASCRGLAFGLLTHVLKMLPAVVVRDTESMAVLEEAGVSAELSWDVAFTTQTTVDAVWRAHMLLERAEIRADRAALISVRPFDAMYPANQAAFEAGLTALAQKLLARGHDVALLIQSDVAVWDEDRSTARRIAASDKRIRIIDCVGNGDDPDPVATLTALLEIANIAVGVRYHTTVLRLAAGRQPFNLYYSRKGRDLQNRLGITGCHVDDVSASDIVSAVEATAGRTFDARPLQRDIQDRFRAALAKVRA